MSKTLCALPFVHLNVMPAGTVHPCCASPFPIADDKGENLNIRTHSFAEMWNSAGLREIRRQMLAGEKPRHCGDCYLTEEAGFSSSRTNYNGMILKTPGASTEFTGYTRVDPETFVEVLPKPTYVDLRFDNVCNLKCVICFGAWSSAIESDPVHTKWTKEKPIDREKNRFTNSRKWVASDRLFEELLDLGENVEYIRLAGGEPFRSAAALRWLDHLVETGKAANITLQVYTNFQRFDERLVHMLAGFKFVSLILSIDAVGPTYEYVRFPGKWSLIERNAALLVKEKKDRLKNVAVSLNATMSLLGALKITEVFDWAGGLQFGVNLSNAVEPDYVSIRNLPERTKDRVEKILRDYALTWPGGAMSSQIDQWVADMRSIDSRNHPDRLQNVLWFIADMDASRKLDFRALESDLMAELEEQCGALAAASP